MNKLTMLSLCAVALLGACRSGKKAPKDSLHQPDLAALGDPSPSIRIGGNYKLKGTMTGFYFHLPKFVEVVPNRFLGRGHVVQILDTTVGEGWARVKNENFETGYVKMDSIRVVPVEDEPAAPRRAPDAELDLNMKLD